MIDSSGYRVREGQGLCCDSEDFVVNSCGHYRLVTREQFVTNRPMGREDYQLIYLYRGAGRFFVGGNKVRVEEGFAVLYEPGEPQWYEYTRSDTPDVYWIHFSGRKAHRLLAAAGLQASGVYWAGVRSEYAALLDAAIQELQVQRPYFMELTSVCIQGLLALIARSQEEGGQLSKGHNMDVERAVQYFNQNFSKPICIQTYAQSCNMTPCWFIRSFKRQMGVTPQQYLTSIRINKAKELLSGSAYNVGEIAEIVGYQNPLYFSRVFSHAAGCAPTEFRRKSRQSTPSFNVQQSGQDVLPARFESFIKD